LKSQPEYRNATQVQLIYALSALPNFITQNCTGEEIEQGLENEEIDEAVDAESTLEETPSM
jgi:hypothetical protein